MFSALALLGALACPQQAPSLEAVLRDRPAADGASPAFLVEGKIGVPDGHTVLLYLYFGIVDPGLQVVAERVRVRGGAFTHEFRVFKQKNLAGPWILLAVYDPNLQPAGADDLAFAKREVPLRIGTELEAQEERKAVAARLAADLKALAEIGREVKARSAMDPRPDAAAFEELARGWRKRAYEFQKRARPQDHPEYRILGLAPIADGGMEHLSNILRAAVDCAVQGQHGSVVEGVTRLESEVRQWVLELAEPRLHEPHQFIAHIRDLRSLVRETGAVAGEPVLPRRRRFIEMMQVLDRSCPPDRRDLVVQISQQAVAFFAAAADATPQFPALREEVDKALGALAATWAR